MWFRYVRGHVKKKGHTQKVDRWRVGGFEISLIHIKSCVVPIGLTGW